MGLTHSPHLRIFVVVAALSKPASVGSTAPIAPEKAALHFQDWVLSELLSWDGGFLVEKTVAGKSRTSGRFLGGDLTPNFPEGSFQRKAEKVGG